MSMYRVTDATRATLGRIVITRSAAAAAVVVPSRFPILKLFAFFRVKIVHQKRRRKKKKKKERNKL
jgi:hypothetical protein